MSVIGLFDSAVAVCRVQQGNRDAYGDVPSTPVFQYDIPRCALLMMRMRSSSNIDEGAGNLPTGTSIFYFPKKYDAQLGDVVYVRKGPMKGTWWELLSPSQVSRADHRESYARPYVGKQPVL